MKAVRRLHDDDGGESPGPAARRLKLGGGGKGKERADAPDAGAAAKPSADGATAAAVRPKPTLPIPVVKAEMTFTLPSSDLSRTEALASLHVKNSSGQSGTARGCENGRSARWVLTSVPRGS